MRLIRVALDIPLSTLFDYFLADEGPVSIGQRVVVPFARKQLTGVVMALPQQTEMDASRIRMVEQVLTDVPPLPEEILQLLRFCSDYYQHPLGMTVMSSLPVRMRSTEPVIPKRALTYMLTAAGQALDLQSFPKRKQVQHSILQALQASALTPQQVKALAPSAMSSLKRLMEAGWVQPCEEVRPNAAQSGNTSVVFANAHALNDAQHQAVERVRTSAGFGAFLLHGITGSGKTEVYVHLMHHFLQHGGQVLLLVPEINLTPQLEHYFQSRFPETEIISLHSGLNDNERTQNWLRAQAGDAKIILGTRLSVFTPLPQLALILVDEEHDASFKQQDGLRYSARDVAIFRASQRGIPVVLGSATPSLESWHNATSGRYTLLQLKQRANALAQLPQVRCINVSNMLLHEGFSPQLLAALETRLKRGEQSLVFLNRRGHAPVLMCTACGWLSGCPNCAGKLVLHLNDRRMRCHHCGHQQKVPHACPSCGNADLQPVGIGTQRIEAALQAQFPAARILRVDRDSTRNKGSWQAMRKQIEDAEVDILVGTQMLAKGHDFPNLTLVGVLNPDNALYSSDFRAAEKLYAQLSQVAGRAGRADKPGEVLVQTAFPEHPLYRALLAHDYASWAQTLLAERRMASFPPISFQVLLRAEAKEQQAVFGFMHQARTCAADIAGEVEVYGVVPAAMPRRANHFLAQLLVQSAARKSLQQFLRQWRPRLEAIPTQKIRWSLDVDPQDV